MVYRHTLCIPVQSSSSLLSALFSRIDSVVESSPSVRMSCRNYDCGSCCLRWPNNADRKLVYSKQLYLLLQSLSNLSRMSSSSSDSNMVSQPRCV